MVPLQRITEGPTASQFKRNAFEYRVSQFFTYSPSPESDKLLLLKPAESTEISRSLKFEVRQYMGNRYNIHMIRGYAPGFSFNVLREGGTYAIQRTLAESADDPCTYVVTQSDLQGYQFSQLLCLPGAEDKIISPPLAWPVTEFHPFDTGVFLRELEGKGDWESIRDQDFNEIAGLGRRPPLALRARTGDGMEDDRSSATIRRRQMIRFGMESPTEGARRVSRLRKERGVQYDNGMDIGGVDLHRAGEEDRDGVVGILGGVTLRE
ncbi:uncharacterized protein PAC_16171 [Phialocephala subalpina]|uniref:Uncharacterized protein n=1 Tax=Phialocephala subalpina TaxID=576137 RepID=A0A1L7XMJ0_9HELO|nr:uncharacterized protein PAC_16171 [Phialocephala subalpina]